MATVTEILDFIAPGLTATADEKATAIELAEAYRPECLVQVKQDEAVALYAAWLLYGRQQSLAASGEVVPIGIKSQTDGDLSRTYSEATDSTGVSDPAGYYARWKTLHDVCKTVGAITVGLGYSRGGR